jgi:sigma-E factor negative regulatory protein RseB
MHRAGLLLTAAVTVTVPGVLALLAVLGHDHGVAGLADAADGTDSTSVAGQAAASDWPADPFPVAPSNRRAGAGGSLTPAQLTLGASLLGKAAAAGLATSYQGTELISQSGMTGEVTEVSQVWHTGGGATVMRTSSATPAGARATVSYDDADRSPAGVFGVTSALVTLLARHYVAAYLGGGSAVGRPAAVVDLYRLDGSLAARYWLDKQTMVPLRRDLFDTTARVICQSRFTQVRFGGPAKRATAMTAGAARAARAAKAASAQGADAAASSPSDASWVSAASPARFLTSLSSQGWRLPATLPGGLPLYAAAWTSSGSSRVVDLEYTDGLDVVSLFVQRGTLGTGMTGWRQLSVNGEPVYVSGHSIAWADSGLVYTMIADASPATVTRDVAAVRASSPAPGLLGRLGRGLDRLAKLVNPFG